MRGQMRRPCATCGARACCCPAVLLWPLVVCACVCCCAAVLLWGLAVRAVCASGGWFVCVCVAGSSLLAGCFFCWPVSASAGCCPVLAVSLLLGCLAAGACLVLSVCSAACRLCAWLAVRCLRACVLVWLITQYSIFIRTYVEMAAAAMED